MPCGHAAADGAPETCPGCGQRGAAVQVQTVKALLTEVALARVATTGYRFCGEQTCDVVYFGEAGACFGTDEIRVPVWQKRTAGDRVLCYCFGEREAVIRAERLGSTRGNVLDRIRDHIAARRCACEVRNPRGVCCLADVMAAVRRIEAEVSNGRTDDGAVTNLPNR